MLQSMSKLAVFSDRHMWRIGWEDEEDGIGLELGQSKPWLTSEAPTDREAWECWTAERTAATQNPERDSRGYYWYSESDARSVFRVVKAALKAERPLPEWAVTALSAGFKAPKGWQP